MIHEEKGGVLKRATAWVGGNRKGVSNRLKRHHQSLLGAAQKLAQLAVATTKGSMLTPVWNRSFAADARYGRRIG
jgi:hypothetical protein